MNDLTSNNYSWLDIIEPVTSASSGFMWQYFLLTILLCLGLILLNKYFNLRLRFNFWLLSYKLGKNGDIRKFSKKLLKLFSLEKNTMHAAKCLNTLDCESIVTYRAELLCACYSKNKVDIEHIHNTLDKFRKCL